MVCKPIELENGARGFVCYRPTKHKCKCGREARLLCDWKVEGGTCDKPICEGCAISPAPGKDLCHEHAKAWQEWRRERAQAASSEGE